MKSVEELLKEKSDILYSKVVPDNTEKILSDSLNGLNRSKIIIGVIMVTAIIIVAFAIHTMPVELNLNQNLLFYTNNKEDASFYSEINISGKLYKSFLGLRNTFDGTISFNGETRNISGNNYNSSYYLLSTPGKFYIYEDSWNLFISKNFDVIIGNIEKYNVAYPAETIEDASSLIEEYIIRKKK